ncbi:MAG TPA: NAD-dependent epimerase/dehydratase family protein [Vicinamibacterales bacterium]|nr:NAD-dependent epimerase/dehydratase family protein [Vicinamibacterales bacterium]
MPVVLITGSAGLIGSEAAEFYCRRGDPVVGIDNDMRSRFFGRDASTRWRRDALLHDYANYVHYDLDIRDRAGLERVFREYGSDIGLVLHAAAQPSHDWAARDPHADFSINAAGTLVLLEAARRFCPDAVFVLASTNKVYGDHPNHLPLIEEETRWEISPTHRYRDGIDESMSLDGTMHSLFGVSKTAADLLVQEYGRYFGMKTACFRAGCVSGPNHAGSQLHGFLSYLTRCVVEGLPYTVFGYRGKQVRDNIHSHDYVAAVDEFYRAPRTAAVYNIGGGRCRSCSVLEAIRICEEVAGRRLDWRYSDRARPGDHIWWITDTRRFSQDYPGWRQQYDLRATVERLLEQYAGRTV